MNFFQFLFGLAVYIFAFIGLKYTFFPKKDIKRVKRGRVPHNLPH